MLPFLEETPPHRKPPTTRRKLSDSDIDLLLYQRLKDNSIVSRNLFCGCAVIQNGHHVIFEELLKEEPELAHYLILSICLKLEEPKKPGIDETSNLIKCLKLILKQINVDDSCIDVTDIPIVLSNYFNDCLKKRNHEDTNEDIFDFDYRCLMSHNIFAKQDTTQRAKCETEVLLDIARNEKLNNLLKHPLLSSFLYEKWSKIRHVLYANIVFYGIFYFLLNTYILIYESSPNENGTQIVNNSFDVILNSTLLIRRYPESLLQFFVIVLWLLFTIREILLFACCPCRYWMNWENWLQVVLIIFTLILLCGAGLWSRVAVILLSALMLTTLISQHSSKMSVSFERFRIAFLNFMCSLFQYLFLIVAFALVFYIFFKNNKNFSDPGNSFFKTLIMITGEFNSNDIPYDSHAVLSYIVFVLFVFFTTVFLFKVNRDENVSKAELNGLIARVRLFVYIESIALGKPFSWFSWFSRENSRWNPFSFLTNRIFLFFHLLENNNNKIKKAKEIIHNQLLSMEGTRTFVRQNKAIDLAAFRPYHDYDSDYSNVRLRQSWEDTSKQST